MGRSRSGSPGRRRGERDRDREYRDRDRDRERHRERRRKRSPRDRRPRHAGEYNGSVALGSGNARRSSYSRSRSRSRSVKRAAGVAGGQRATTTVNASAADLEGKSPDEQEMLKTMGFCSFDTTKGKKVEGNDVGAVHVILKRKYRQYMNRKGGFNRPLDFVA